jgi:hypothetical protein
MIAHEQDLCMHCMWHVDPLPAEMLVTLIKVGCVAHSSHLPVVEQHIQHFSVRDACVFAGSLLVKSQWMH